MRNFKRILGYTAAGVTVAFSIVAPFFWFDVFTGMMAKTGLRIDPTFTGGELLRTIERQGYTIAVHRPVPSRALFSRTEPFVQLVWRPAAALPDHVSDAVDLDGDARPDLVVSFRHANNPRANLRFSVIPLTPTVRGFRGAGKESFSCLIARVGDSVVVRVPMKL